MAKPKLLVIGNGMAGIRTVEELIKLEPDMYDITVLGQEPYPNYNRILLSPVLAGEQKVEDIILNPLDWYAENKVDLHLNVKAQQIDRIHRVVKTEDGRDFAYDRLLLATGSRPLILPIPGATLPGVVSYRDIHDTEAMIEAAKLYKHAVVIGGGLLGLEAANGLKLRGMDVTVVHRAPWLLERQLDEAAARLLQKSLQSKGLKFAMEKETAELIQGESGRVAAIKFRDGEILPADLVVMAVGILPHTELAEQCGLHCNRGVVVNDTLQTYDPRIYAVGECVNHRGMAYGLVAPLFEQAKVCANHLAQFGIAQYKGSVLSTKLKVTGIDLFSAGDFMGAEGTEDILLSDPASGIYKKLVLKDDKLVGACLYGDTVDGAWYFKLMREGRNIGELRDHIIFGESNLGDTGHQGHNKVATMQDSDEVCGCNGITKGAIVKAINEQGLFTVDEVKKCTKAASSCGSCTGLVEQILMNCLGSNFQETSKTKAVCGCTSQTHEEVRQAIRKYKLVTHRQVFDFMEWRTPDGCPTCRPAINYYLISTWPHEAKDDPQSRFINERAHANIQRDGTFSVIPQMKGGVTNASELRRIADVADKYAVPMIKVTGGQRIDLLGIKKEHLVNVWKDLGMQSGYAYGKSIRTVKTCVGKEFCRFGTQNSTQMGIDLETMLGNMWSPHKVKLAVSGCPRNCAEASIKDVGIIAVDSGWELYIGGNGGIKTEVAQFLCKVKTPQEVKEFTGAFLQLYREEAWYLDRTVHWLERVGMEYVKARVVDDAANRAALYERLLFSLKDLPDPWKERVEGAQSKEFQPLSLPVEA